MKDYHINIFYSDEDGGYVADIPDLDACSAFGKTSEEALAEVTKARDAWLQAAKKVSEFYESEGRLATEHSLLDDNGDGLGTPADWFRGLQLIKGSKDASSPDGRRAHQIHLLPSASDREMHPELRAARDAIERELSELRHRKPEEPPAEYAAKLEEVLVRLARLYGRKANEPL